MWIKMMKYLRGRGGAAPNYNGHFGLLGGILRLKERGWVNEHFCQLLPSCLRRGKTRVKNGSEKMTALGRVWSWTDFFCCWSEGCSNFPFAHFVLLRLELLAADQSWVCRIQLGINSFPFLKVKKNIGSRSLLGNMKFCPFQSFSIFCQSIEDL